VGAFNTESRYDYLTVNSLDYSGSYSPDGVAVAAGTYLYFYSDGSVSSSGFSICAEGSSTTTTSDDDDSGAVAGIVIGVIFGVLGLAVGIIFCLVKCIHKQVAPAPPPPPPLAAAPAVRVVPFQPQPVAIPEAIEVVAQPQTYVVTTIVASENEYDGAPVIAYVVNSPGNPRSFNV
jgi:hypothetical protein